MKIKDICFFLLVPMSLMYCSHQSSEPVQEPETPLITDYILSASITNKELSSVSFDNAAKTIEVQMPHYINKKDVRIRLTLNEGVTMEYPSTAEAAYDLSQSNTGV
jgi:hypothetical protein